MTGRTTGLRDAQISLSLGLIAMIALPISYQWVIRPASAPAFAGSLIPILEYGGLVCSFAAFFFGRRARAAGDSSIGAVWGIRLAGAAVAGYLAILVFFVARSG